MRPNGSDSWREREPSRRQRFELFYYEQVGSRYYLQFTQLALLLIVGLTALSLLMIFAFYLWGESGTSTETNVNITPTQSNYPIYPGIRPAPSTQTPGATRQSPGARARRNSPADNSNSVPPPNPTPSTSTTRTPT